MLGTVVTSLFLLLAPAPATPSPDALARMTPEQLKRGIQNAHPATYYVLATKLLESGQNDDAVFWFYAGQLRFRFHLAANPSLEPSGDPALFASFQDVVGRPVNEYAWGDLPALHATLERVLAWDKENKNGFTSTEKHAQAWNDTRAGLQKLIDYIDGHGDEIKAQRKANGLANRK